MIGSPVIFGVSSKDVIARLFGERKQEDAFSKIKLDRHGIRILDPLKSVDNRPRAAKYV